MKSHTSRLAKLEATQGIGAPRIVVKFADEITAAERAELGNDPNVVLVLIEYASKAEAAHERKEQS